MSAQQGRGYDDRGLMESLHFRLREIEQRLSRQTLPGRVVEVDYAKRRARVEINGQVSGWLPWAIGTNDAGAKHWEPLHKDAQVLVQSIGGDPAAAVILPVGIPYQDTDAGKDYRPWVAPDDSGDTAPRANIYGRQYADGTVDTHDVGAKHRKIVVPAGGTITFQVGSTVLTLTDGKARLEADEFEHVGTDAVLDAFVHIGGRGGVPVSKEGTVDTGGYADVTNLATRATIK